LSLESRFVVVAIEGGGTSTSSGVGGRKRKATAVS